MGSNGCSLVRAFVWSAFENASHIWVDIISVCQKCSQCQTTVTMRQQISMGVSLYSSVWIVSKVLIDYSILWRLNRSISTIIVSNYHRIHNKREKTKKRGNWKQETKIQRKMMFALYQLVFVDTTTMQASPLRALLHLRWKSFFSSMFTNQTQNKTKWSTKIKKTILVCKQNQIRKKNTKRIKY